MYGITYLYFLTVLQNDLHTSVAKLGKQDLGFTSNQNIN